MGHPEVGPDGPSGATGSPRSFPSARGRGDCARGTPVYSPGPCGAGPLLVGVNICSLPAGSSVDLESRRYGLNILSLGVISKEDVFVSISVLPHLVISPQVPIAYLGSWGTHHALPPAPVVPALAGGEQSPVTGGGDSPEPSPPCRSWHLLAAALAVRLTRACRASHKATDRRREQGRQSCTPGLLRTAHPQGLHGRRSCQSHSWRGGCSGRRLWQNPFFYRPPWLLSLSRTG